MTVKRTGGGAFDPADRPLYFASTLREPGGMISFPPYVLVAANELPTEQAEATLLLPHLDAGRKVLLDSGIFWLTNRHKRAHGCTMDEALALPPEEIDGFTDLYRRYVHLVKRYGDRLWGFIELDQGGRERKRRTRGRLEAEGLIPIPVYHPFNDGWDYFDELAAGYDRMCLGNIVQAPKPDRVRLLHTLWERHRAYPGLWVHVLGLTASELCLSLPFESCDSSAWQTNIRFHDTATETALMRRLPDLGPRFAYDLTSPRDPHRGRLACLDMCADGVSAANRVWRHAAVRVAETLGQQPLPARLPSETLAVR